MSTASQSPATRFFGILKNLFSRAEPPVDESSDNGFSGDETSYSEPVATSASPSNPSAKPSSSASASGSKHHGANVVVLPLQTVIMSMSRDLRAKVCSAVSDDLPEA
jgi:hypothetical protein